MRTEAIRADHKNHDGEHDENHDENQDDPEGNYDHDGADRAATAPAPDPETAAELARLFGYL